MRPSSKRPSRPGGDSAAARNPKVPLAKNRVTTPKKPVKAGARKATAAVSTPAPRGRDPLVGAPGQPSRAVAKRKPASAPAPAPRFAAPERAPPAAARPGRARPAGMFGSMAEGRGRPERGRSDQRVTPVRERTSAPVAVVEPVAPVVRTETVDAERAGQRVDNFLSTRLKGVPKSAVYRALRTGQVRVNGKRCKPETRLEAGDLVRIPPMHLPVPGVVPPPSDSLRDVLATCVLFEDKDLLILDKPSGLAAHGGSGVSLGAIEAMRAIRPEENLELVHRLDRDTSGLLMFAKRHSSLRKLQTLIREGRMRKRYLALIAGSPGQDRFDVDAPLRKNQLRGGERMVEVDDSDGKPSLSRFRVIERFAAATLVEVEIVTGRTHQIRVHALHAGHPLAGDEKYGDEAFNKAMKAQGLKRLFLHAHSLEFVWGEAQTPRAFSAALSPELKRVLEALAG